MTILGIDPGVTGGLAVLDSAEGLWLEPMPVKEEGGIDAVELCRLLRDWKNDLTAVYIESIFAMPTSGAHSMMTFGRGFGIVIGILTALDIHYVEVRAQQWMKEMHKGHIADNTKARSASAFSFLFSGIDARRTTKAKSNHIGLMEAALIAEYGRRNHEKLFVIHE